MFKTFSYCYGFFKGVFMKLSPLFKVFDTIYVVSWLGKSGEKYRFEVASEHEAKTRFAELREKNDSRLFRWHNDNSFEEWKDGSFVKI